MSGGIWSEHAIAQAIARQTLASRCVVLVDRCNWTGHECDVLAVTTDLRVIDVEIKISRADLKADAQKDKWWHRFGGRYVEGEYRTPNPVARAWPPRVWKHYYALPAEIWKDDLLDALPSPKSGVLLVARQDRGAAVAVRCRRRATPNRDADRIKPEQVMDIARLANLRMWDAYASNECAKTGRSGWPA